MAKRTPVTPSESKPVNDTKTETTIQIEGAPVARETPTQEQIEQVTTDTLKEAGLDVERTDSPPPGILVLKTEIAPEDVTKINEMIGAAPTQSNLSGDVPLMTKIETLEKMVDEGLITDGHAGHILGDGPKLPPLSPEVLADVEAALAKDAEADADKGIFDFDGDLEETTVNDARSVADWKPTHRVRSEQNGDMSVFGIMFVPYEDEEGGSAFTLEEWRTGALADFTRGGKGEWLFLEQPFTGSVAAINRDFTLHLVASEPGIGGQHLYPDSSAHDLGEYEAKEEAIAIGRAYLSEHPEAWLQVRGRGAVDNIVKE